MVVAFVSKVYCQEYVDVLKIENVPFPHSSEFAASVDADFNESISEFTVCYRILIESYNDGCLKAVSADLKDRTPWDDRFYNEQICKDFGFALDGYQEAFIYLFRNIPGGGIDGVAFPIFHTLNLPRNVKTSKWYTFCTSYSSVLHKIHKFQNGLKVFSFTFSDEVEKPMPSNTFKNLNIGQNLRGQITDLNVYSSFFDEDAMIEWTTGCKERKGDIFSWDATKLNTRMEENATKNITIVTVEKKSVCHDPKGKIKKQLPVLSASKSKKKRFRTNLKGNNSLSDSVLELMTDSLNIKNAFQCEDLCYRLNGELLQRPETKEEEDLMDRLLWNFMLTKAENNITFLTENYKVVDIWAGGVSKVPEQEKLKDLSSSGTREHVYPPGNRFQLFHSFTGKPLSEVGIQIPYFATDQRTREMCPICHNSMRKPAPGNTWLDRKVPWCSFTACHLARLISAICVFPDEPVFTIRGLCSSSVVDKEYEIAKHKPIKNYDEVIGGATTWGLDNTRSYVGPKGWIISINQTDKSWSISHFHYKDLTLKMVDTDILPFGRHKWLIENNVCTEGKTSTQVLQISGCKEGQFTCDDGKCLDIAQRCNNIEVY